MLKIILSLSLFFSLTYGVSVNSYVKQLNNLTQKQKDIMISSYIYGMKKNIGYELATIAWKESGFGLYPVNINDGKHGSFGVYHIRVDYAFQRVNISKKWDKSRYIEKLLYNLEFAASEASDIYLLFRNKASKQNQLRESFAMYNGGYGGLKNKKAINYGIDCVNRYEALKIYFKNNNLEDIHLTYDKIKR